MPAIPSPARSLLSFRAQVSDMQVHTLYFTDASELTRSFSCLAASESVEDCLVEPDRLRIRFLAPAASAEKLVERIYLDGGLKWCSRSSVSVPGNPRELANKHR